MGDKAKGQLTKRVEKPPIPENMICKWQEIVNLMAEVIGVPAALIMKVIPPQIEVFVSSASKGNPYKRGEKEDLDSGLYCEKVMREQEKLLVPDARKYPQWDHNPDIKLGMVSCLGFPLMWPDGELFGTICVLDNKENHYCKTYEKLIEQFKGIVETDLQIIVDITERKQAKEALRRSENLLFNILNQSPFSTWIADAKGTNIRQNAACRKLFGIDYDEQTVWKYNIFTDPVIKKQGLTKEFKKVFEKGETIRFTVDYDFSKVKTVNVPRATHRLLDATIFPVKDANGKVINAVVQHEDITERKKAEEEKNKLLKAIETSREAIGILSADEVMIYTNDAKDKLFGYKKGKLIGRHVSLLNAGPTPEGVTKQIADTIEREGFWEGEIHNKRKDGTEFISYARISTLRDKQGKITNYISTQHDITDRKKTEEVLRLHSEIMMNMSEGIFLIRARDGIIVYANPKFEEMFGYLPGELVGKHISIVNAPSKKSPEERAKEITEILNKNGEWQGQIRNIKKDGTPFWCYAGVSSFRHHEYGDVWVAVHLDITERKKADEALRESEQRYRTLFEKTVNPILVIDTEGNYITCNEAALQFVECTRDELLEKNIRDFIPPSKERQVLKEHRPLWENGGTMETEYYVHGKCKILELTITPAICHGKRVVFGIGKDITGRKKAKEEKEKLLAQLMQSAKMAALGTLASGIAHEFSNLLQIVIGHVAFAQRTKKTKDVEDALNIVLDISDKATKIIKDLLTFSGQEAPERELCDITELIELVLLLAGEQLKKHNIRVVRKYERIPLIEVNKAEMQQVFLTIVINARDAMLPKGERLEICVKQVKGNIEVSFSDTGKGIEKENLSKVFEPFYTTKGAFGGSTIPGIGLGLSVSYGIIQRYKGTIEVNSRVGKGTTFTVKLPMKEVRPKERVIEEQKKKEIENTQYMNILVMDDEEEICKIFINWLSAKGHRVKSALTGREAIELVKNEYFNVAFLDIIMPGIPGNIVLEEIKKLSPETKVVMITGKLMNDYLLNKLRQKGASGCIQKPFGIEKIKEALV